MAADPGSTDAENGVTIAGRDRFGDHGDGRDAGGPVGSAGAIAEARPAAQQPGGQGPWDGLEIYGDSAYGSGQARAGYGDAGHDTIIKPGPLRPAVPGGFTIDDFTVDEDQGTVTCPNGVTRPMSSKRTEPRPRAA